jgi:hypothetical protein
LHACMHHSSLPHRVTLNHRVQIVIQNACTRHPTYTPPHTHTHTLVKQMLTSCGCDVAQEVANTLWAVASLEHNPGVALLDAASVQILRRLDHFSPQ